LTRGRCFFSKPFASEEIDEKRGWLLPGWFQKIVALP
jgi:hypothetical protein